MCIYFWERGRETEHKWGRGTEREGDQNPKQVLGSELSAQSLMGARTHQPWDHDLRWSRMLNWATQASLCSSVLKAHLRYYGNIRKDFIDMYRYIHTYICVCIYICSWEKVYIHTNTYIISIYLYLCHYHT